MNALAAFGTLTLVKAAPLIFAALAGVVCERSGILNIALEGALTVGAFAAVAVSYATGSPLLGLLAGIGAGALLCALLGIASASIRSWRAPVSISSRRAARPSRS
jgi:ABC-type uncharacterized transport system permease subunit